MAEVLNQWDAASMIAGLRHAAKSPKDQVAITRQLLVEAADLIEALVSEIDGSSLAGVWVASE